MSERPLRIPRPDEIAAFHQDGAVLLKQVLPADWLAVLEQGLEIAYRDPDGLSAGVGEPLRIDHFPSNHVPQLASVIRDSPLAELVGQVLDAPVRFYMDQVFYKPVRIHSPISVRHV